MQAVSSDSIYRAGNVLFEQSGRGNNYGLGYNGPHGEDRDHKENSLSQRYGADASVSLVWTRFGRVRGRCLEAVRKEAERCDIFTGVVTFQSVSGGTGSGLGARIVQELRTAYSKQFILSACVTPFAAGETPLQHYNSVLSFAQLQRNTDGVLWFRFGHFLPCLEGGRQC